jgi:HAMP domain-containing protein
MMMMISKTTLAGFLIGDLLISAFSRQAGCQPMARIAHQFDYGNFKEAVLDRSFGLI